MGDSSGHGHYRRLLDRSPAGLLVTRHDGEILDANRAAAEALGYDDPDELVDTNIRDRYAAPSRRAEMLESIRDRGEVRNAEFEMLTREGETAYLMVSVKEESHPDYDGDVLLTSWVDVTQQRMLWDELQHRALHDDLTGLLNRRTLFERAEQVLAMCDREDRMAAVVYLDIAGFRQVNEQLGHRGGDEVLAAVGERLRETMRDSDLVARVGGDEFVLVGTLLRDEEDAEQVGRRVLYAFDEPFEGAGLELQLQPAAGIALFPEDGTDMDTLVHQADRALWGPDRKKAPGIRRFRPPAHDAEVSPMDVPAELKRGLQRGDELFQVFQPVVSADGDRVPGLESLVRWRHPEHGLVSPGSFIPEAEASGLVREVDRVVFRNTVEQVAEWSRRGMTVDWVSVNLSAQSLSDPGCVEWTSRVLESHPDLPRGRVVIEVTEHTAMQQVSKNEVLQELNERVGISISIDDFGIGYSSLLYLRQFPAEFLKIDIQFVRDLVENEADRKVIRGIIALGEAFDMELIAEGVESEAQEEWLREAGCHYLQGYRFGRPAAAGDVESTVLAG